MIIAARRAPAAAGGPHPRRISARDVQRHALPGWLAWHEPLGEWTLRTGGGFTRRANSCHAVGDPGMPIQQAAEQIIGFAVAHDIAPLAQVIEGSPEEHALQRLGWVSTDQPTAVLTSRLADFLEGRPAEPVGEDHRDAAAGLGGGLSAQSAELGRSGHCPDDLGRQPSASLRGRSSQDQDDHSELVAIARGHRNEDWLGLASIWTRPDHRRRGLATAMMAALGHWAARQGARYAYLQVATVNESAIAAYHQARLRPSPQLPLSRSRSVRHSCLCLQNQPPLGFSQMTWSVGA